MDSRCLPILGKLALASAVVLLATTSMASAGEAPTAPQQTPAGTEASAEPVDADATSIELRFVVFSPSARWSRVDERGSVDTFHSKQSLYFGPGIGVHVFPKQPHHGVIVDTQYSLDTDVDKKYSDRDGWRTDFIMARVGYGYRFIRHTNEKMVWAFTPHASLSTGASINRDQGGDFTTSAPLLGGRVGVNVDLHINRFIMGWAFAYEGLAHLSGGPLLSSHFVSWTLIPVFRIGVDLGPRIQSLAR